jgi:hypothetical protein
LKIEGKWKMRCKGQGEDIEHSKGVDGKDEVLLEEAALMMPTNPTYHAMPVCSPKDEQAIGM